MCLCLCSDMLWIPSFFFAVIDTVMMIISLACVVVVVVDLHLLVLSSHPVFFDVFVQESKERAQHNAIVPGTV